MIDRTFAILRFTSGSFQTGNSRNNHLKSLVFDYQNKYSFSQLPLDHSATVNRAMKYFTEIKAVVDISHDADILMSHLQEVGGHLVQQGVAKVIHPIYIKSKYRINPTAQIRLFKKETREMSSLSLAFRDFVDSRTGIIFCSIRK